MHTSDCLGLNALSHKGKNKQKNINMKQYTWLSRGKAKAPDSKRDGWTFDPVKFNFKIFLIQINYCKHFWTKNATTGSEGSCSEEWIFVRQSWIRFPLEGVNYLIFSFPRFDKELQSTRKALRTWRKVENGSV